MKLFDKIANSPKVMAHAKEMDKLSGAERKAKALEHPFLTYLAVSRGISEGPVTELSGGNFGAAGSMRMEELAQANQELEKANEKLEAANKRKDEYHRMIAHDLRSPFTGLLGLTQIMLEEANEEKNAERIEMTQMVYQSAQRLFNMTNNMLEFSESQGNGQPLPLRSVDPRAVVEAEINEKMTQARFKGIKIHNRVMAGQAVRANEQALGSVVRNLIANAIKFSAQGGEVWVRSRIAGDCLRISVEDHGVGMDHEMADRIFTDERITTNGTAGERGSGHGTKIVRNFMQQMGGEVWVESEQGEGSKFIISLPMHAPEEKTGTGERNRIGVH